MPYTDWKTSAGRCQQRLEQRSVQSLTIRQRVHWAACVQAAGYYAQAKNSQALADALYRLEDLEGLDQLTAALPEGDALLLHLAESFQSVGLCQQAVSAYLKVYSTPRCFAICHRLVQQLLFNVLQRPLVEL